MFWAPEVEETEYELMRHQRNTTFKPQRFTAAHTDVADAECQVLVCVCVCVCVFVCVILRHVSAHL